LGIAAEPKRSEGVVGRLVVPLVSPVACPYTWYGWVGNQSLGALPNHNFEVGLT
jgi:hypothetical protein